MANTSYQQAKSLSRFEIGEKELKRNLDHVLSDYSEMIKILRSKYDIPKNVELALKSPLGKWKNKEKISRASYVIPLIYIIVSDRAKKFSENNLKDVESILVSLDVIINNLDDSVDILSEDKKEKWKREIVKAINFLYLFFELNKIYHDPKHQKIVIDKVFNFIIILTQIPFFERKYSAKITKAKNRAEEKRSAVKCLQERARDVDIFIDFMSLYLKLEKKYSLKISKAIKDYRALELFSKDYYDIKQDLKDKSFTPLVSLFKKYRSKRKVFNRISLAILDELYGNVGQNDNSDKAIIFLQRLSKEKYNNLASKLG